MIQLHQSDWIMISMWVASASSFLSLPAIIFLLLLPLPSLTSSLPVYFFHSSMLSRFCIHILSKQSGPIICSPALNNSAFCKALCLYLHCFTDTGNSAPSLSTAPLPFLQYVHILLSAVCSGGCSVGAVLFSGCHIHSGLWEGDRSK